MICEISYRTLQSSCFLRRSTSSCESWPIKAPPLPIQIRTRTPIRTLAQIAAPTQAQVSHPVDQAAHHLSRRQVTRRLPRRRKSQPRMKKKTLLKLQHQSLNPSPLPHNLRTRTNRGSAKQRSTMIVTDGRSVTQEGHTNECSFYCKTMLCCYSVWQTNKAKISLLINSNVQFQLP